MAPLEFVPRGWFTNDFDLKRAEALIGSVVFSGWGGALEIGASSWSIKGQGFFKRAYTAGNGNTILGEARPEGFFRSTTRIKSSEDIWTLQAGELSITASINILQNGDLVGQIMKDSFSARRGRCILNVPVEDELQAFLIWLTLRRWYDESSAA
jgi:hypothetical protein